MKKMSMLMLVAIFVLAYGEPSWAMGMFKKKGGGGGSGSSGSNSWEDYDENQFYHGPHGYSHDLPPVNGDGNPTIWGGTYGGYTDYNGTPYQGGTNGGQTNSDSQTNHGGYTYNGGYDPHHNYEYTGGNGPIPPHGEATVVPEPASLALMGIGLAPLLMRRRKNVNPAATDTFDRS